MQTNSSHEGYTAQFASDPCYYGSSVTQEQADQINARLGLAIRTQFPGIEVNEISIIGGNSGTLGENQEICDEVDEWIANNWTAASNSRLHDTPAAPFRPAGECEKPK